MRNRLAMRKRYSTPLTQRVVNHALCEGGLMEKDCDRKADSYGLEELSVLLEDQDAREERLMQTDALIEHMQNGEVSRVELSLVVLVEGHPRTAEQVLGTIRESKPEMFEDVGEDKLREAAESIIQGKDSYERTDYHVVNVEVPREFVAELAMRVMDHLPKPDGKKAAEQLRAMADAIEGV